MATSEATATESPERAASLTAPTADQAMRITREVSWDERLDGRIDAGMAGYPMTWAYSLGQVANLLSGMSQFVVDYDRLQRWVDETIGDPELAGAIGSVIASGSDIRASVTSLLAGRIAQCEGVLGKDEPAGGED